ncbi:hypothetical protein OA84_09210 [Kaistella solincola]|uniref:Helix-turn-helix domain-containing protein n=1 Tax=Kaistella solincola TaxID=510955 RepID=A0ABR4ZSA9_9FLAO|nr:helix-turn-helix domain-containing protein [Kaistella solincola]KIA83651.1 hypothetical protein OA84_09210 [Kaistella solincola]
MNERKRNKKRPSYRTPPFSGGKKRQTSPPIYDNADMMQLFHVSGRTLQRWRKEGIVPYKKIGGKIFYLAEDVLRMMRKGDDAKE